MDRAQTNIALHEEAIGSTHFKDEDFKDAPLWNESQFNECVLVDNTSAVEHQLNSCCY